MTQIRGLVDLLPQAIRSMAQQRPVLATVVHQTVRGLQMSCTVFAIGELEETRLKGRVRLFLGNFYDTHQLDPIKLTVD